DERRRESSTLADQLSKVPLNLLPQRAADAEEMARLSALGYLSGAAAHTTGPLRNPRDHIKVLARVQQTFVLNQEGRYRESVALCREILRDDPDLGDVSYPLAGNLRRLRHLPRALEASREGIRPGAADGGAV